MKKSVYALLILALLVLSFAGGAAFAVETLRLSMDGVVLESDVPPF